jgi:hypothetical protein
MAHLSTSDQLCCHTTWRYVRPLGTKIRPAYARPRSIKEKPPSAHTGTDPEPESQQIDGMKEAIVTANYRTGDAYQVKQTQ